MKLRSSAMFWTRSRRSIDPEVRNRHVLRRGAKDDIIASSPIPSRSCASLTQFGPLKKANKACGRWVFRK